MVAALLGASPLIDNLDAPDGYAVHPRCRRAGPCDRLRSPLGTEQQDRRRLLQPEGIDQADLTGGMTFNNLLPHT